MAKNTGKGRRGAIRGRTQFRLPSGHYAKRDRRTGEILAIKKDMKPFKGVVMEKDTRHLALVPPAGDAPAPIAMEPIRLPDDDEREAA
ncbi:MAG TPA: hypothetical protein VNZ58_14455 [Thermomicrobiales bacterium]|nr:hypothetical protein [Thermomicrobiales bacterium]